ncbi:MAG: class I SAM-dependent methyltransferase [Armatimonadota bacterium]|nr:class I SAM-dependent methyltransferase [bacterium]MDW8320219.1 class I SAM-dependent methyltransferase [Armatimonadota bacterium]
MTDAAFTLIAPYYDELMHNVPYDFWVRYVHELIDRYRLKVRSVLDLACGTGNVAMRLAKMGYEVWGVDISAPMVAEARAKAQAAGLNIPYEVQDAAQLQLPKQFDLVLSLFDSLNYILLPERLQEAFQRVYAHLQPGGAFVFDVNTEYALREGLFDQDNLGSRRQLLYRWKSRYDEDTKICTVEMEFWLRNEKGEVIQHFVEMHRQRAYGLDELTRMLRQAGFDYARAFHAYTLQPPRETTDRAFFVATKW